MEQQKQNTNKEANRSRSVRVFVRLHPDEKKEFEARCKSCGLTQADYFRKKCLEEKALRKRKAPTVETEVLLKTLAQIGKVGGNLNQIARELNMGYLPINGELETTLKEVRELRTEIRKALGYGD